VSKLYIFLSSRNYKTLDLLELGEKKVRSNNYCLMLINQFDVPSELKEKFDFWHNVSLPLEDFNNNLFEIDAYINNLIKDFQKENIEIITFNENLVLLAAYLREKYNLSGLRPKDAVGFVNKARMYEKLLQNKVTCPDFLDCKIADENNDSREKFNLIKKAVGLPFVLKPAVSSGSRKLMIIKSYNDFILYADLYIQNNTYAEYVAQQYIEGDLYHMDTVIDKEGKFNSFCGKYNHPMHLFLSGKTIGGYVIDEHNKIYKKIKMLNDQVLKALNAAPGVYHLECFVNQVEEVFFLEVAARPPGGLINKIYQAACGVNLIKSYIQQQQITAYNKQYAGWAYFSLRSGKVCKLNYPELKSSYDIQWRIQPGDIINKAASLADYAGSIFFQAINENDLINDMNIISNFEFFTLENSLC